MVFKIIFHVALLAAPAWLLGENWESEVVRSPIPSFARPISTNFTYSFGWSGFQAGSANVSLTASKNTYTAQATGATVGFVRSLWSFDVSYLSKTTAATLRPVSVQQSEQSHDRKACFSATFDSNKVHAVRELTEHGKTETKTRQFQSPAIYDLLSSYLTLRTYPWKLGDTLSVVVYPAFSSFLVRLEALNREEIQIPAGKFAAIPIRIELFRINQQHTPEPFPKFKRATVWLSDDSNRYVLKIDAEIFVGTIFVEMLNKSK